MSAACVTKRRRFLARRGSVYSLLVGLASVACNSGTAPPGVAGEDDDSGFCEGCCEGPCSEPPFGEAGAVPPPIDAELVEDVAFTSPPPNQSEGGPCVTSIDCAGGLVCGYDSKAGCDAQGECVVEVSGAAGPPACGCDGNPVQYVAPGYTSVPVASPTACDEDASVDSGDAQTDAPAFPDGDLGDAREED